MEESKSHGADYFRHTDSPKGTLMTSRLACSAALCIGSSPSLSGMRIAFGYTMWTNLSIGTSKNSSP